MEEYEHQLTQKQLFDHLNEQLSFLKFSCKAYDDGNLSEAKRIAIILRILLHDKGRSVSLFTQLGLKQTKFFSSNHEFIQDNLLPHWGLMVFILNQDDINLDKGPDGFLPKLGHCNEGKWLDFEEWWNEIVFCDSMQNSFNRKELVLILAEKFGGAHIDPKSIGKFYNLVYNNSGGMMHSFNNETWPMSNEEKVSIRQIAYELFKTLDPSYNVQYENLDGKILIAGMHIPKNPSNSSSASYSRKKPCFCGSGKIYKKCHGAKKKDVS